MVVDGSNLHGAGSDVSFAGVENGVAINGVLKLPFCPTKSHLDFLFKRSGIY